jgi:hypothetical protein
MVLAPAPLHIAHGAEPVVLFDFEGGGHARNCTGVNGRRPLQITLTTARTHLAHIFEKTGTRRQAEVVPLILQSAGGRSMATARPETPHEYDFNCLSFGVQLDTD